MKGRERKGGMELDERVAPVKERGGEGKREGEEER